LEDSLSDGSRPPTPSRISEMQEKLIEILNRAADRLGEAGLPVDLTAQMERLAGHVRERCVVAVNGQVKDGHGVVGRHEPRWRTTLQRRCRRQNQGLKFEHRGVAHCLSGTPRRSRAIAVSPGGQLSSPAADRTIRSRSGAGSKRRSTGQARLSARPAKLVEHPRRLLRASKEIALAWKTYKSV
jgi:hypothetical protein